MERTFIYVQSSYDTSISDKGCYATITIADELSEKTGKIESGTTSIRLLLRAIIDSLRSTPNGMEVIIRSSNLSVIMPFVRGEIFVNIEKTQMANTDLWELALPYFYSKKVILEYVPKTDPLIIRCRNIANRARSPEKFKKPLAPIEYSEARRIAEETVSPQYEQAWYLRSHLARLANTTMTY